MLSVVMLSVVMLSVVMLSIVMLSDVTLSAVMLSVVAPIGYFSAAQWSNTRLIMLRSRQGILKGKVSLYH